MAYSASPVASLSAVFVTDGGTSASVDTTGCDILIVAVTSYNGSTAPTLSDSKSNSWNGLTAYAYSSQTRIRIFYAIAPTVGSGHTFTLSGTGIYSSIYAAGWSGSHSSSPFDVENGQNLADPGAGYTIQPGSVTPSEDDELVVAALGGLHISNGCAIDSGFTLIGAVDGSGGQYYGVALAYKVQTTAAAVNPTWTWSDASVYVGANATFKKAAAGGATTRGTPFGSRGTAFNGGRTFMGILR